MDFTFYSRVDYFQQLAQEVRALRRGDRALVASMPLASREPAIAALIQALTAAAQRGVAVTLIVDAYTFLSRPNKLPGPLWYRTTLPPHLAEPFRSDQRALQTVAAAGGRVAVVNQPRRPFSLIQAGRSHIKGAVINDKVYIGGANLGEAKIIDVMVAWHDETAADWLYDRLGRLAEVGNSRTAFQGRDEQLAVGAGLRLLLDAGVPKQSIILDAAYRLIDEAETSLFMTCQYFPGGATAQHLLAAYRRGVSVELFYSHPSVHGIEAPAHFLYAARERTRLPQSFFANRLLKGRPKLHSKLLCSEQAALIGSHNYVTQGVALGTAELALEVHHPDFARQLRAFLLSQLHV